VDFDNGLNRAINRLRAALGDEADNPRFIETLDRRGYRFIAPVAVPEPEARVTPAESGAPDPAPPPSEPRRPARVRGALAVLASIAALLALGAAALHLRRPASDAAARESIRSLAVLPLANLSGDPTEDYFSDGMTDALLTNLAAVPGLRVISRQSVMRYKGSTKPLPEIARELGVEGVVEGSVVRAGGRVRITAQLIHAATDRHLWARSYERPLEDVLALQAELARAIAEEVRITVAARPGGASPAHPVKPAAYDAYLLGRHQWNQRTEESLDKALGYFQRAVDEDPGFALAHAGLALAYGPRQVFGYVPPGTGLSEQKAAALRALELDPGVGEARAALAAARAIEWDWEGAEAEFRRTLEADPGSAIGHLWYGWYLRIRRRFDESLAERRRALALDPLNISINGGLARDLIATGQSDAALAQARRALELEPDNAASHLRIALFHVERGDEGAAAPHLDRVRQLGIEDALTLTSLAVVEAARGDVAASRRGLAELQATASRRYVSPVLAAMVHAALGETDRAAELLEKACAARDPALSSIQAGEVGGIVHLPQRQLEALRAHPRFVRVVQRMGLLGP
jgi:TolB-like protein/Tfp pilus assembly protein PilF